MYPMICIKGGGVSILKSDKPLEINGVKYETIFNIHEKDKIKDNTGIAKKIYRSSTKAFSIYFRAHQGLNTTSVLLFKYLYRHEALEKFTSYLPNPRIKIVR